LTWEIYLMRNTRRAALVVAVVALAPIGPFAAAGGAGASTSVAHTVLNAGCGLDHQLGRSHCFAKLLGDAAGRPLATAAPSSGYGPADLQGAYGLAAAAASNGGTQTIAIVDAFDDKTAEADLAGYRSAYGLPACTTANGCFKKVNQSGVQGSYPTNDQGWAVEISLDLDMVSAACPHCKILLVEATSNANTNLYAAVDTAARLGATVISNSYGGGESSTETTDESHFNHPGIPITVSSGDSGYGVEFPAASRYVTAVGGTSLSHASNARGWSESVWSGAGSGCSAYEAKQAWQTDTGCARRTVADVSAVADPNTGVAVYDTNCTGLNKLLGNCFAGWGVVGGTSVSAPFIAAVYGLAGNGASVTYASYPYSHTSSLNDVTSGSNGSCSGSYLCTGTAGYDGPTGLGTPNGTGAF
jgi:subtilase family serine protease